MDKHISLNDNEIGNPLEEGYKDIRRQGFTDEHPIADDLKWGIIELRRLESEVTYYSDKAEAQESLVIRERARADRAEAENAELRAALLELVEQVEIHLSWSEDRPGGNLVQATKEARASLKGGDK